MVCRGCVAEFLAGWRIAIDEVKGCRKQQAGNCGGGEGPSPASMQQQNADERNTDSCRELCRRVKDGGGQPAFFGRKPKADGLCIGGKDGRFADAEQHARSEKSSVGWRYGGGKRGYAPEQRTDAAHEGDA